jgi:hypothetical protein
MALVHFRGDNADCEEELRSKTPGSVDLQVKILSLDTDLFCLPRQHEVINGLGSASSTNTRHFIDMRGMIRGIASR